jgi:pyruvate carboxylase subunit B
MATYTVTVDARTIVVRVGNEGEIESVDGKGFAAVDAIDGYSFFVLVDQTPFCVCAMPVDTGYQAVIDGRHIVVTVESERARLLRKQLGESGQVSHRDEIRAPMPALVVRVEVEPGDQVSPGQGLLVLEAMKMENEVKSSRRGIVKEIHVAAGGAVEKGELLLVIE